MDEDVDIICHVEGCQAYAEYEGWTRSLVTIVENRPGYMFKACVCEKHKMHLIGFQMEATNG